MSVDFSLRPRLTQLRDNRGRDVAPPPGGPHDPDMEARLAVLERIAQDTATTLVDLRGELRDVRGDLRDDRRDAKGRQAALVATIIGTGLAVAGLAYTTQANLLAAFQTGLTAVQSAGGHDAPQPIVIQIPAAPAAGIGQVPAAPPPRQP